MRICMISGESNPFLKTGGLGDVVYSLSKKLVTYDNPTSIIMPYYPHIDSKKCPNEIKKVTSFNVKMNWRSQECVVYQTTYEKITFYFLDNDYYFYNRNNAYGYDDDAERFAFFQLAAMELINKERLPFDIIHVHDWQTGMIPLIYQCFYKGKLKKKNPKFVLTIHNSLYVGYCHDEGLFDYFNIDPSYYHNGLTRFNDMVSYLKTGIMTADKITTVSPTYADELLRGEDGSGLQGVYGLRKDDLVGIINGIDMVEWDPRNDKLIPKNYSRDNFFEVRKELKEQFVKELGFTHPEYPLFVAVTRLSYQKGIDLIAEVVPDLVYKKCNVYILGTGQKEYEEEAYRLSEIYHGQVVTDLKFSNELAHISYAVADFFLIPSRYEPCGLTQMYSHRYGSIPLARATGGLVDTIVPYNGKNTKVATGILFEDFTASSFKEGINLALELYSKKRKLKKVMDNGMKINHSWTIPYKEFIDLYKSIKGKK